MRLKYNGMDSVTVMVAGQKIRFVNGEFETEDKKLINELLKNKNITEIKEEKVPEESNECENGE